MKPYRLDREIEPKGSDTVIRVEHGKCKMAAKGFESAWLAVLLSSAAALLLYGNSSSAAPGDPWEGGQWGSVIAWPHIPVSAANLPDGRIITWSGSERLTWPTSEQTYSATWNPQTLAFQEIFHPTHNMFCSHLAMLKDGRVFVNGGRNQTNSPWTSLFNYETNTWNQIENMASGGRWYPTTVALPSGEVFTAIGTSTLRRYPDVWNPTTGWSIKNGIDFNAMVLNEYESSYGEVEFWPLLHVAPNGQLFHSGPTPKMHYIDPQGGVGNNGSFQQVGTPFTDWYIKHGTTVMYDVGKLLTAGGWRTGSNTSSTNRAFTIDLNGPSPVLQLTNSMTYSRKFHNGVVLPTGEVLVIGGNTSGVKFSDTGTILATEIWNPVTGQWRVGASMNVPRNYHSIGLLLTDGRVLSAGGGYCSGNPTCGGASHPDGQIYSPPYLFNTDGSLASRPSITTAPAQIAGGIPFELEGTPGIQKFSMVKMSSTTHGMNTDLRYVTVPFVETLPGIYLLTPHANVNVLTPGFWMLFALDGNNVPSVAQVVQANAGSPPSVNAIPNQITLVGDPVNLQVIAIDPDDDPMTYGATGLPGGLSINSSTGLITGTPANAGIFQVSVTVDDHDDGVTARNFQWTIVGANVGYIEREWWTAIAGNAVGDLTSDPRFPDAPSGTQVLTSFQGPIDSADEYGSRIAGYLEPDTSGLHTFWIASDDNGELWLSSDTDPANKVLIASVPEWTAPQEWNKFASQQSAPIDLVAGQRYYIEALQKEGTGGDNLAVGWQRPGDAGPAVIPGGNLSTQPVGPPDSLADTVHTGTLVDVGSDWVTVYLPRNYADMVVVATPQYDASALPAVTRIRNAAGNSFDVRVQHPGDAPLSGYRVQYVVVESGVYNDGNVAFEAGKFLSTTTSYRKTFTAQVASYQQAYQQPAVIGQVMTANDPAWSVFWASSNIKHLPANSTQLRLGKHVAEDPDQTRADETLGYIVFESGTGFVGEFGFEAGVGDSIVAGLVQPGSPDNYPLGNTYNSAVLSSAGMQGGDGGWPLLFGADPLAGNNIALSYDEDQLRDSEREHQTEYVAYLALSGDIEVPLEIDPVTTNPAVTGSMVSFTVNANQTDLLYSFSYGDGTPATPFTNDPNGQHSYAAPGRYVVTINIIDPDTGNTYVQDFIQLVHFPLTGNRPTSSGSIIVKADLGQVWAVNPDNDSVTVIDQPSLSVLAEIAVGDQPVALASGPGHAVWVANKRSATISVVNAESLVVDDTIAMTPFSQPHGIAMTPAGDKAYVALEATGELVALLTSTGAETGRFYVGPRIRHVSVSDDASTVLVSRFVTPPLPDEATASPIVENSGTYYGGEVIALDAGTLSPISNITLRNSDRLASEHTGPGVPNYLGPAVISPDGLSAWVPSKQDNILAGTLRGGDGMTHDQTVRAVTSKIDLLAMAEFFPARIDHDNASIASAAAFDRYGAYIYTALEGNRELAISDAYSSVELLRFDVGRAPQGVALSADGNTLYVHNFMDRSVGVFDISSIAQENQMVVTPIATVTTVSSEALSPQILSGKQMFYDARDPRLSMESYMSCASCHNDGGEDGRVWDFTGLGEGLRNTITLQGTGGMSHGFLHRSANFNEIQDFEDQIRNFSGGTGLMSDSDYFVGTRSQPLGDAKAGLSSDLDALAAYVNSLTTYPDSPYRNSDGTLTPEGELGLEIFERENCAQCHAPVKFTDSVDETTMHDVGTLKPTSGNRLGGPLTGIDTPTLIGAWQTAPYLHDGSVYDVTEAVTAHSVLGISLTPEELNQLGAYLEQLDGATRGISNTAPVSPVQFGSVTVSQPDSATWHSVAFAQAFDVVPAVVMGPPSYQDSAPTTVRVRNVTASGFEFQIDEWEYLDGAHGSETVAWIAAEPGSHDWGGISVRAGSHTPAFHKWRAVQFNEPFAALPVVLAQLVTVNEPTAAGLRIRQISTVEFGVRVIEEEAQNGVHANETIHYIALSAGAGAVNGAPVAVGSTGATITQDWSSISFGGSYPAPLLFASIQENAGNDTIVPRHQNLLATQFDIIVEEEQSADAEVGHNGESIGWLVISSP